MKQILTIIVFTLLGALSLRADTKTYTVNVPITGTDWTNNINLPKLLSSYGQLTNILITAEWVNHRKATFFSLSATNAPYDIKYTNTTKLLWPDGTTVQEETHREGASGLLGYSGSTYVAELTNTGFFIRFSCVDFPMGKIAPYTWIGTGTLPFKAQMNAVIDVSGMDFDDIFPTFTTEGSISVSITYWYTPGGSGVLPCH